MGTGAAEACSGFCGVGGQQHELHPSAGPAGSAPDAVEEPAWRELVGVLQPVGLMLEASGSDAEL